MHLPVVVPDWIVEGDGWAIAEGMTITAWLAFSERSRYPQPADTDAHADAVATPLDLWPGAELARHPTKIEVAGTYIYWDAPAPAQGAITIEGTITAHNTDAPEGFPMTTAVITRVRNIWRPRTTSEDDPPGPATLEDVPVVRAPRQDPAPRPTAPQGRDQLWWSGALVDLDLSTARKASAFDRAGTR